MKKPGLFALALITAAGAYAQKGVEDGSRYGHGQDSIRTRENISIYVEYYKTNNFKDAYDNGWKAVFDEAPLASVNTYNYGVKILRALYNDAKAATLFNFRNCYTVEDIAKSNISYSLEFLWSEIQHYFFIDRYEDINIYAVRFYTISIPDEHRESGRSEIPAARCLWSHEEVYGMSCSSASFPEHS